MGGSQADTLAQGMKMTTQSLSRYRFLQSGRGWLFPIALLLIWECMSRQSAEHAYAFASIPQIYHGLVEIISTGELQQGIVASLQRAFLGLLLGGFAGFIVGIIMTQWRVADVIIGPLYHMLRQVPLMGLVPLFSLWLGNGDPSKLVVVCLSAFYPLVLATYESLYQVEVKYKEVGDVYKLSRWQAFFKILLPAALPNIFTGVSFALAFAWLATIGSEILFSAGAGLGNIMMNAQAASRMDILIVLTVLIGFLGYGMNFIIQRTGRYFFRWRNLR
ncbi:sulfonate transport system permease protein [Methylobacillus rhizosphaerae]|uniref:Sulfonate transport system permease protein n=1 Tax=Methylobacillus rhizosphaerae TaxID=551994 RepID=A0A238ZQ83_9PROT|nr:ABC transporter permease [Methylobacillus rhizosphaerae]SNR85525.1 sulfonate transport system permease protein [Methylobacillus rhizosphaerae]